MLCTEHASKLSSTGLASCTFYIVIQCCSVEVCREGQYQSMPPAFEICRLAPRAVADVGSLPRGVAASCFLLAVSFASSESSAAQMSAHESTALTCPGQHRYTHNDPTCSCHHGRPRSNAMQSMQATGAVELVALYAMEIWNEAQDRR